jgi:hypothetical protein
VNQVLVWMFTKEGGEKFEFGAAAAAAPRLSGLASSG